MKKKGSCGQCGKSFDYDDTQKTGKWCSNACQMANQYESYIKRWKAGQEHGNTGKYDLSAHIRRYLFDKHESKCCQCGWGELNPSTGKVPLHVDHVDGDFKNNQPENLRLLCPNCHSLTENYGILNRGKGRYSKTKTPHPSLR
jgi:hypothetical protein